MQREQLVGELISLQQLADLERATYIRIPFYEPSWCWTKRAPVEDEKGHELAELTDILVLDVFNLYSFRHRVFISEISYPKSLALWGVDHTRTGSTLEVREDKPIEVIEEPVFVLGGHDNHYHWLLNWLPRGRWMREMVPASRGLVNCKVLVHGGISPAHLDSLRLAGISADRIVKARGDRYYHLKRAWVPSFYDSERYNKEINAFLRESFRSSYDVQPRDDVVFVDRNGIQTPRRRIHNHEQVQKTLGDFDVRSVRLENMSFAEQVQTFSGARILIAAHGAGLANLVFCRPGTNVIIFEYKDVSEFVELAKINGLKALALRAEQHVDNKYELANPQFQPRLRDFVVDCDILHSALSRFC